MNEEKIEYEYYTVDFEGVNSRYTMYDKIKNGLDFPDYFGANLSAIWDCLTDMVGEKIHIEIIGIEVLRQRHEDAANEMIEILNRFKHYCDDQFVNDIQIDVYIGDGKISLS